MRTIALIGAGGKMGMRLLRNLARGDDRLLLCETGEAGLARLAEVGQSVVAAEVAMAEANVVIFAVPDAMMGPVTAAYVPWAQPGAMIITLDPAAAMANEVALRDDLHYIVCHPCHPPLFGEQSGAEARKDFFGGIAAVQDIVIALMRGSETAYAEAEALCRAMFAPVGTAHRVTVEQMAVLEPAMAEVVAATAAVLMREALEEAVRRGVPRAAATAFMLGHAQIPLAIVFGAIDSPFSDAAKVAIRWGAEHVINPEWRKVFEPDAVKEVIHHMLHPEPEP